MERVRLIVLNFNTASLTIKLVSNLQKQQYNNFEIVVVDNSSSIHDQQLLTDSLPSSIYLIMSKTNLGYSGGNNLGMRYISEVNPDYYFILNSDVAIKDDFLIQKLVEGFKIQSSLPIFAQSPLINTLSSQKPVGLQIQVRRLLSPLKLFLLSFSLCKKLLPGSFNSFIYNSEMPFDNKYMICDSINGAAFMVKADFMKSIDYLDDNVFLYHEEMILAKQINDNRGACLLNGFLQVDHFQGVSTGSNLSHFDAKMERLKFHSEAYFFRKYLYVNPIIILLFKFFKGLELQLKLLFFRT